MQKRHGLVCEGSLCPRKLSDVSRPGLGEAGCYRAVSELYRLWDESLDRTGRVLGLLLSKSCLLKLFCYYNSLNSKIFTRLTLIFLYRISFRSFGPEVSNRPFSV